MDQNKRNLRHAAAQTFMRSLTQLEETLQPLEEASMASRRLELEALEAAAADIEQFIQTSGCAKSVEPEA